MKVGFHSPLPPAHTGVADYSAVLLRALRGLGEVEVGADRADVQLYHVANNVLHWDIYRRALEHPGVVVLHDALLQHLFMGALDEAAYCAEFAYNYGDWSRDLAADLWRNKASSGLRPAYYRYPMLKRLVERSARGDRSQPGCCAYCTGACAEYARNRDPASLFRATSGGCGRAAVRARPAAFVFAIFGYLRESKRVMTALRAFERIRSVRPETALVLAGEFVSSDLKRAIGPLLCSPGVHRIGTYDGPGILARGRGYRRLHQPPLSHRGRDIGHRHPVHGYGETSDRFER